jgi:hypothetical protein
LERSLFFKIPTYFLNGLIGVNYKLIKWAEKELNCKNVIYLPNFTSQNFEVQSETILKGVDGKRILCLANLRDQKNHFLLLEVAEKLKMTKPDWTFHLVGKDFEDDYSTKIKELIQSKRLVDTVFVYGSKNDVNNIINQADIAILTSKSEGLPVALIEYGLMSKPVISTNQSAIILELYKNILMNEYEEIMRKKLGFSERRNNDKNLIQELMELLASFEVDYTIFFRKLCDFKIEGDNSEIYDLFKKPLAMKDWEKKYTIRLKQEGWAELNKQKQDIDFARCQTMKKYNPKYILRNYLAENAIRNATYAHDYSEVTKLRKLLRMPFEEQPEFENYASHPPQWAREISLSCSS